MLVQDLTVAGAPDPVQKTAVQSWRTALIPSSVAFQDMPYTAQYQSSGIMCLLLVTQFQHYLQMVDTYTWTDE